MNILTAETYLQQNIESDKLKKHSLVDSNLQIFVDFGVSDRNRFFTALTVGLILETTVFAITGISGYKMISP